MSEFINTIDVLGDDAVIDGIIDKSITEFKDNVVTNVSAYAFHTCTALTEVDLPNVTNIGRNVFEGCSNLEKINAPNLTGVFIGTFQDCAALKSADFPLLTKIFGNVFVGCHSLEVLNLPSVTSMEPNGIMANNNLKKVVLPALTDIPGGNNSYRPFGNCPSLEIVDFTAATTMGWTNENSLFSGSTALKAVILRNTDTVCTLMRTFIGRDMPKTYFFYFPRALVDSYKSATNWSEYASQFRALEDYTVDGTITGELDETKI